VQSLLSTTYGHNAMDGNGIGYADHVKVIAAQARMIYPENERLERLKVYNKGDPGESIGKTAIRLGQEFDAFGEAIGNTLITALLGTYDHVRRVGSKKPITSEAVFQAGLGKVLDICKFYDADLALLGLPPIDGARMLEGKSRGQVVLDIFEDDRRLKYEDIVRDFADRNNLLFREVRESLGGTATKAAGFVSFDGVHCNAAAHSILTYHALAIASQKLDLPDLKYLVPNVMETPSGLVIIKPELEIVEVKTAL
jgi:hypothetical protein